MVAMVRAVDIADAIEAAIRGGTYRPGGKLPSAATFAIRYGVHHVTAGRAFGFLKDRGLVVGRRGSGTFVRDATSLARALARRDTPP
jgi:DNA-binding GntR family transcriptional regulator